MTHPQLQAAYDPERFREQAHRLVDRLADQLTQAYEGPDDMPVLPWKEPDAMLAHWQEDFKASTDDPLEIYEGVLNNSIRLHHPRCIGHQVVPPVPLAVMTDMFSSMMNTSMAVYEMGSAGTAIEQVVLQWLAKEVGLPEGNEGVMTSGGSAGNLTALLAARQAKAGFDIWEKGAYDGDRLAVMVSEEAHYCVARAAKIMGLGEEGVIKIPADETFRARPEALEGCLAEAQRRGRRVFAVIGSACTTSSGTYDPLHALADFCQKHDLWFHVDGAHGGAAALSEKYRHYLAGAQRADSVVIDFHKMLLCPSLATAVLFADGRRSYETFAQQADYLFAPLKGRWHDIAMRSLECTKRMMGLKVYALLKTHGRDLFEAYVEQMYDRAREFEAMLRAEPDFEVAHEAQANILCFRLRAENDKEADRLNSATRERMKQEGKFYIVNTRLAGKYWLRVTVMNPFTDAQHFRELIGEIRRVGESVQALA